MTYAALYVAALRKRNPQKLRRLERSCTLPAVLNAIEEAAQEEERRVAARLTASAGLAKLEGAHVGPRAGSYASSLSYRPHSPAPWPGNRACSKQSVGIWKVAAISSPGEA